MFVWTNSCIHSTELVSRNTAVGPYKNKSLKKCDNTIIIYLLLHFMHILHDIKCYFRQDDYSDMPLLQMFF